MTDIRIGHGYDVHRMTDGRKLILGGVTVPFHMGLDGHSDADVLIHAICDALLGAAALGDIGKHFPDSDDRYKGIDSRLLLRHVVSLLADKGYKVSNIDATVIMQRPKVADFIPDMVNVKATTEEKLGFTGSGEGAAAHAVCLITGDKSED